SLKTAAKKNGLPPSTLRGRLTGAQSRQVARQEQLRLTTDQEDDLERWILRQEKLGHAPTHAQVRTIVRSVLARHGDHAPLGRKWTTRFVERHPALKTKLGRRTDWERVNAATPANIKRLFDVYETVDWIPPERRYNADEGGIMEGQGVNGLVIGSSQESPNAVPVKTATVRTWTSIIECISAVGAVLYPLVIFKAKSIQEQWFRRELLEKHLGWQVTFSKNGWTGNSIALEWLEKVFLPQTAPADPADARLLIVDGHGSHATEEFMAKCYLNNVYLLFLPAHCSHVLQPLDLGCFSSLKAAYRTLVGEHTALTDSTRVGKQRFLDFYARAREIGFRKENIRSGWRAAGLWPVNINKPLASRWVMVLTKSALPPSETHDIVTPKRGGDVVKLFSAKSSSPSSRLSIRKAAAALDKVAIELAMKDREIERLRAQLEAAQPKKKGKIRQDPNECFISLAQILAEANREPDQRVIQSQKGDLDCIVVDGKSSSESEEDRAPVRRSARVRRPTKRKKDKIQSFMSDHEEAIGDNRLLVGDWELLGKAHTFLLPFASAALYAEGDDSSISQSLMLMDMLLLHYEEQQVPFNLSTSSRLLTLYQKIYQSDEHSDERMVRAIDMGWFILSKYYRLTDEVPVYAAALLLDPPKRIAYIKQNWPKEWHEDTIASATAFWQKEFNYEQPS
ncbi:hypothetical protein HZ326_31548, partial [Fusarium oxysporum f. sp. albedinis]